MPRIHKDLKHPLFIGLPGAGKTMLASAVAEKTGMTIIGTDPLFRIFRALPADDFTNPRAEVMRNFLLRAEKEFTALYPRLKIDAEMLDAKGRCALHDSVRFRTYGEDVFRTFEIEMLKWLDANGDFENKIVDLSASAPLYEENQKIFRSENGYVPILVDTPQDHICRNILKDYKTYREQSRNAGEPKPIRGAYEKAIDDALGNIDPYTKEGEAIALKIAAEMTEKEAAKLMDKYRVFASGNIVTIKIGEKHEAVVEMILKICSH